MLRLEGRFKSNCFTCQKKNQANDVDLHVVDAEEVLMIFGEKFSAFILKLFNSKCWQVIVKIVLTKQR
jgi:hypothetical protein